MDASAPVDPVRRADDPPTVTAPPATPTSPEQITTDHPIPEADPQATTAAVTAPTDFPPSAGRCRIEGEIARGGMAVVYRALDPFFGRHLAVKVLLARGDERPDLVRRFVDESRVTGRLQHPGVPPVHEQGGSTTAGPTSS
jgi:eukaryotic-like serine/threonine-protein kinase